MSAERTPVNGILRTVGGQASNFEDGEVVGARVYGKGGRSVLSRNLLFVAVLHLVRARKDRILCLGQKPRFGSVLAALASLTLVVAIAACGGDEDADVSTFERDDFPFTFQYPADFELTEDVSFSEALGDGEVSGESLALALNDDNVLILQSHTLNLEVGAGELSLVKGEFDRLIGRLDSAADGEQGEIGGFPSLAYDAVELSSPEDGQSRYTFLFDGDQEYVINCQSTLDHRDEIAAACEQALETLTRTEDAR
jgi:hypothetical protein